MWVWLYLWLDVTTGLKPEGCGGHRQGDKRAERIDLAIERAWSGLDGRSARSVRDEALVANDPVVATYGEVTAEGARQLFAGMRLGPGHVFADLGSGVGRLAAQAYVECELERAIAVEFFESRHARAREGWKRLAVVGPSLRSNFDVSRVRFECSDVLDAKMDGVTHAFVSNYCFDDNTNEVLARKLASGLLTDLRVIATSRPFPQSQFPEPDSRILVDMSWSPRVVVNLYFPLSRATKEQRTS